MGITKTEKYSQKHVRAANLAKAIGHPARLAIIKELLKSNKCKCGDLVLDIGLAQSTISKHLKELKDVGLIAGNIEGNSICYCIDPKGWKELSSFFSELMAIDVTNCNDKSC